MCMMGAMTGVLGAGMQIAGAIAQNEEKKKQTEEYNREAAQNAANANIAATNKYSDLGRKLIYDSRALQQEGGQAAIKGMQAQGATAASAGSAGVSGSSVTVNSILADEDAATARNLANIKTKQDDAKDAYNSDVKTTMGEAQQRINSMPFKDGPSGAALGINIASAAVGGLKGFIQ